MTNHFRIIFAAVVLAVSGQVWAAGPAILPTPAEGVFRVSENFSIQMNVDAAGNKVCAVEGTLNFQNLSCQKIDLAKSVIAQKIPTCADPRFLIGLPSCSGRELFQVQVKGVRSDAAEISLTGVDTIGEGVSLSGASIKGNYVIEPAKKVIEANLPLDSRISDLANDPATQGSSTAKEGRISASSTVNALAAAVGASADQRSSVRWWLAGILLVLAVLWFFRRRKGTA
jgi:hypothetical protein